MNIMGKCEDLIGELSDYLDGELEPELCKKLEKHLSGCGNCRLMVDTMKKTVQLCRDGSCEDLPEDLQQKLNQALAKKWKKKFGHF
jgi:predicted anti-sigma-YlaC factor YlaD